MTAQFRARARRHTWWLAAVLLLAMLAPGIGTALAHARGDFSTWQDVCRAPSATAQPGQAAEPGGTALKLLTEGHCPACHLGTTDLAAPPVPPQLPLNSALTLEAPERFWTAPVTAHAWRPASARAPPGLI
ncbi:MULTISPECIES: DUF2946 family protein [unclassified Roseateles]|uniref:DUF2946 family protein n=1 Tax=unclassified Roseateles TaxID=2626991 RepID=UPI0006F4F2A7|nr:MULTISPECIES: DUF2946 family protein [unclassified Roseateles]KQW42759.1 hypothetical protein ASC81_19050 [Pelomonas sp. Root405]KRA69436.1 hypothetical protein ASD88_19700 [Pelomonas sp. Root662]